jgi:transcriptional antiterminator NusG
VSDTHETDARPDDVVLEDVTVEETVVEDGEGDMVDQVVTETVAVDSDGDLVDEVVTETVVEDAEGDAVIDVVDDVTVRDADGGLVAEVVDETVVAVDAYGAVLDAESEETVILPADYAAGYEEELDPVESFRERMRTELGDWYVIHSYAGYENKVKTNLESRIASMNMEERIYEVVIPMEDVIEFKNGKKVVVQKKVFPGYLLARLDLEDRKSTRLNSSHNPASRMPSSA